MSFLTMSSCRVEAKHVNPAFPVTLTVRSYEAYFKAEIAHCPRFEYDGRYDVCLPSFFSSALGWREHGLST